MSRTRRQAELYGRIAETVAAVLLALKGFRIIARRFATKRGEIDIVAQRGRLLVFVEVKARRSPDEAAIALTETTRRRVCAAAEAFVAREPHLAAFDQRFDAVLVWPRGLRHLKGAWLAPV